MDINKIDKALKFLLGPANNGGDKLSHIRIRNDLLNNKSSLKILRGLRRDPDFKNNFILATNKGLIDPKATLADKAKMLTRINKTREQTANALRDIGLGRVSNMLKL